MGSDQTNCFSATVLLLSVKEKAGTLLSRLFLSHENKNITF